MVSLGVLVNCLAFRLNSAKKVTCLLSQFDLTSWRAWVAREPFLANGSRGELSQVLEKAAGGWRGVEPRLITREPTSLCKIQRKSGSGAVREATQSRVCAATSTQWGLENVGESRECLQNCLWCAPGPLLVEWCTWHTSRGKLRALKVQ